MSRIRAYVLVVAAAAMLTGCATTAPDAVDSTAAQTSSATIQPTVGLAPVEVDVRLTEGRVEPFPHRVDVTRGAQVTLQVTSDTPTEIHVHGYDLSSDAAPGATARIQFIADQTGVFEVEAHPDTLLFQLAVR